MIGEVGGGLGHVAAVAGRADTAALAGEGHYESRAERHADRAGEAEAEEPALEIAAEFVLEAARRAAVGQRAIPIDHDGEVPQLSGGCKPLSGGVSMLRPVATAWPLRQPAKD